MNATVRMLAAIKLSDVDPANGKQWFVEAYNDGAIEDNADNFVYKYYANTDNENPLYTNIVTGARKDFAPNKAFVDYLNVVNDPRRAVYFTKNANGEYKGIPLGIKQADVSNYNKDNSDFAPAMRAQDAPLTMYSAARVLLVEAEAAVRGWISADAKNLYEKAVAASFTAKGLTYTDDVLQNYLAQDGVKFQGTDENKIIVSTVTDYKAPELPNGVTLVSANRIKRSAFKNSFVVPETKFNFNEIKAKFEDGILTITIPPKEKKEYKQIAID